RQAVYGQQSFTAESASCKSRRETIEGSVKNRLRAVERRAPGTQVEALYFIVRDFRRGQLVSEIRSRAQCSVVAMKRAQPSRRPRKKSQRRKHYNGDTKIKG